MDCEVCGRSNAAYNGKIEGVRLTLCERCMCGAKEVKTASDAPAKKVQDAQLVRRAKMEEEVCSDYANRIQQGMRQMTLDTNVLAEKMNIRATHLTHIVQGKITPDIPLAKRLEKELGIKLIEEIAIEYSSEKEKKKEGTTLGDLVEID